MIAPSGVDYAAIQADLERMRQAAEDAVAQKKAARAAQAAPDPRIAEGCAALERIRPITMTEIAAWCAEAANREPRRPWAERLRDAWRRWWARGHR